MRRTCPVVAWLFASLTLPGCEASAHRNLEDLRLHDIAEVGTPLPDVPLLDLSDHREDLDHEDRGPGELLDVIEEISGDMAEAPDGPVAPSDVPLDPWGGLVNLKVQEGTGRFSTGVHADRAFVVTPDGNAFVSFGLQAVGFGNLTAPALGYAPGSLAQMALAADSPEPAREVIEQQILELLVQYGFNTVGGWSGGFAGKASGKIPYTLSLGFAGGVQAASMESPVPAVSPGGFPDVFHPSFAENCLRYALSSLKGHLVGDPWLVGVYSDNEQRWHGGKYLLPVVDHTLTDDFLDENATSPGKQALVAWFRDHYAQDIEAFNGVYGTALVAWDELGEVRDLPLDETVPLHLEDRLGFLERIAEAYYRGVHDALQSIDPELLFLCDRIASVAALPVWRQAGRYCDVVTLNDYYTRHDTVVDWGMGGIAEKRWESFLTAVWEGSSGPRPLWVTEWGLRAADSGLPNTFGAGFVDPTQQHRAEYYSHFTQWFLEREVQGIRYATGWHWFMYMDEPPTGRSDGEDGNYGVVTVRSEPYLFLLQAMASVHRRILSFLDTGTMPSLLGPPDHVEVTVGDDGVATVVWDGVPHAEGYRVWLSHHPASVSRHLVAQYETSDTSLSVSLVPHGRGTFWFSVEPLHSSLLTLGARFSSSVEAPEQPLSGVPIEDVLACDTLETVTYNNQLTFPNAMWGQSYVSLAEGISPDSLRAIRFDFVPSSLGWVRKSASPPAEIRADLSLPQAVSGSTLSFTMQANFVRPVDGPIQPASRFLSLRLLDVQGTSLATHSLDLPHVVSGAPTLIELPLPQEPIVRLQIVLDLEQQGLPMEQLFSVTFDQLQIVD